MRIAVIEHRLRDNPTEDARALAKAAAVASEGGAEIVFFPHALPIDETDAQIELTRLTVGLPGTRLIPRIAAGVTAQVFPVTDQVPMIGEHLGSVALLHGDACMNSAVLSGMANTRPSLLVMTPSSESDLQAEAVLELGIGLSESVAGLVVVAECVGAEPGDPGHGGSAIILLGQVLAEAIGDEGDVLFAEVPSPLPAPEPPEPLGQVPTILEQRLAHHEGRKLDMGYPADLSEGAGPR